MRYPNHLREWRERRGMPIAELARRAGTNRMRVYTIEAGGEAPVHLMQRFADILGVDLLDLLVREPEAVS